MEPQATASRGALPRLSIGVHHSGFLRQFSTRRRSLTASENSGRVSLATPRGDDADREQSNSEDESQSHESSHPSYQDDDAPAGVRALAAAQPVCWPRRRLTQRRACACRRRRLLRSQRRSRPQPPSLRRRAPSLRSSSCWCVPSPRTVARPAPRDVRVSVATRHASCRGAFRAAGDALSRRAAPGARTPCFTRVGPRCARQLWNPSTHATHACAQLMDVCGLEPTTRGHRDVLIDVCGGYTNRRWRCC